MILKRIALRDFRRFANFETSFAPGLNVILGNNEEGKSTLREAITLALFQDPRTTRGEVLGLKRWGASEQFAIDLEFEADGRTYLLIKDFQSKTAQLKDLRTGETRQDARAIESQVKQMLGLPSLAAFESTVRVSQRDIARIQDTKHIADRLQELVTGGEQDVRASEVLGDLDNAIKALKSASKRDPGPLAVLPGEIEPVESALTNVRQRLADAENARGQLLLTQESLEAARRDLAQKEAVERDCKLRFDLEDDLAQAQKEEESLEARLDQARDLEASIDLAPKAIEEYSAVLNLPQEQVAEIAALAIQASAAEGIAPEAPARADKGEARLRTGMVFAGIALAIVGFVGGLFFSPLFILSLAGACAVAWELLRPRKGTVDAVSLATEMRAQERKATAEGAALRLNEMLASVGCSSAAEFRAKREQGEELRRRLGVSRAKLEGFLAGKTVAELEDERKTTSKRVRDVKEQLAEARMQLARMDQLTYQRLVSDISRLKGEVQVLREKALDLEVAVRVNQIGVDAAHSLEEEAQDLREQLAAAQERQQVLCLVRQVLEEARVATMVSAKDALEGELAKLVREITCGRYGQVRVQPSDLSIQLLSPEKGQPVEVSLGGDLSTGTVEQVYLSARVAIARLLARGRRPPFILDDPFVTFDVARTRAALALCQRLSADNQVLLFTCHEGYEAMADKVIRLPAVGG